MAGFDEAQKYLDLTPARVATLAEAQNSNVPFDKYYGLIPTRPVKKVGTTLVLKANSGATVPFNANLEKNQVLFSYFFTLPLPFYLLNNDIQVGQLGIHLPVLNTSNGFICVRWRSGNDETRRVVSRGAFSASLISPEQFRVNIPDYSNELIGPNAVFEFWNFKLKTPLNQVYGVISDLHILINYLRDPVDGDDSGDDIEYTAVPRTTYGVALPANLPVDNSAEAWLDNP